MNHRPAQRVRPSRRGTLLPGLAIAILTVGCCLALVLDKLWLDAARGELQTAAEAAALAAAGRLADDERINLTAEPQILTSAARELAADVASHNRCAGRPVLLNAEPGGHLQFGSYVLNADNGLNEFVETESLPTSVRCRIVQSRELGNPVARLFSGLSGQSGGDAIGMAEASLTNLVVGVRPFEGGPVPALPLAIWELDPTNERTDTWVAQIEAGAGGDDWTFNSETKRVEPGSDGLPEMVLAPMPPGGKSSDANFQILNVGNGLDEEQIVLQVQTGWTIGDLADFAGELRFDGNPPTIECSAQVYDPTLEALLHAIGQKRIVPLYELHQGSGGDIGEVTLSRLVAVRVLAVDASSGVPQITVQPTVVATRTALLSNETLTPEDAAELGNSYVYKISLTN